MAARLRLLTSALLIIVPVAARSQVRSGIRCSISYVAASAVYITAGREQGLTAGDTLRVVRSADTIGTLMVLAVSRVSSAASVLEHRLPLAVGDSVIGTQLNVLSKPPIADAERDTTGLREEQWSGQASAVTPVCENVISGRIVAQYNAILAEETKFNLNQPAVSLWFNVMNLGGTGLKLSLRARSSYDVSNQYSLYGSPSGLKNRAYELSLERNDPDASIGYGVGRLTSRYGGGMGTFDGAEFYYRFGQVTAGILGGAQAVDRTLTFSPDGSKGSFFLNYREGSDITHQYDGTIAYGRQMVGGNLDRQFVYLQNQLSLGSAFQVYESSEIELNDIANGVRTSALRFSNTFLNLNYRPADWLSTNFGYDALRSVYLFETMRLVPDSLIDRNLVQRVRGSATIRFPSFLTITGSAMYGTRQGGYRDSRSLGLVARTYDIAGTEIDAGIRYTNFVSAFAQGDVIAVDLDRSFWGNLVLSLSYQRNTYDVPVLHQLYPTQTASADVFYRISSAWFSSITGDYVYDATMNSFRIFAEIGYRF